MRHQRVKMSVLPANRLKGRRCLEDVSARSAIPAVGWKVVGHHAVTGVDQRQDQGGKLADIPAPAVYQQHPRPLAPGGSVQFPRGMMYQEAITLGQERGRFRTSSGTRPSAEPEPEGGERSQGRGNGSHGAYCLPEEAKAI